MATRGVADCEDPAFKVWKPGKRSQSPSQLRDAGDRGPTACGRVNALPRMVERERSGTDRENELTLLRVWIGDFRDQTVVYCEGALTVDDDLNDFRRRIGQVKPL